VEVPRRHRNAFFRQLKASSATCYDLFACAE
jgi:hypothetical protein